MKTKTTSDSNTPRVLRAANQTGRRSFAEMETLELTNTKRTMPKLLLVLGLTLAATSVFGQVTYVWTNQTPAHLSNPSDLQASTNWSPNGTPQPVNGSAGDTMQWDGQTTGDLSLTINGNQGGYSAGAGFGLNIYMDANQVANLNIRPPTGVNAGTPRAHDITIDAGAGQFSLGDNSLNSLEIVWDGAPGATQTLINNSSHPAVIYPNIKWRMGGGGFHPFIFGGSGDWILNSYFRNDNSAGNGLVKDGTGTLTWTGTNVPNAAISGTLVGSPVLITNGTLILKTYNLLTSQGIQNDVTGIGTTLLKYDAPLANTPETVGGAAVFSGTISGTGPIQVNQGQLTLSGFNTYTGSNNLTGGELIAGRAENPGVNGPLGNGGIITFAGGTLGYSSANTYDYSPRFDASPGQAYSIDVPPGQSVTFATGLTSSGGTLTKVGSGTLTLAGANTYNGLTTVSAGKLVIQGTAGSGNITVADGQTLGIFENGTPVAPGALTLGTTTGVTLEFDNVTNTTSAPLAVSGAISAAGPITANIASGKFSIIGETFPLFSWGSGAAPAVNNPPTVSGAAGLLITNGSGIVLNITDVPYVWTGGTSASWDTSTAGNWTHSGSPVIWQNSVLTLFDDTALGNTNVTITGALLPTSVTVNNSILSYTITSSSGNQIGGASTLTKAGNGTLTVAGGANTYTGVTTVSGGTLMVSNLANGGSASDIGAATSGATNLVLNGGTLQYLGGAVSIDRLFSVGTGGGTLDSSGSGALALVKTGAMGLSSSGVHALTLGGSLIDANLLAANIADGSAPTTLTKSGAGKWILTGTNTYSGPTTVQNGGTLQIGNGGASGTIGSGTIALNNGSQLDFNSTATLTVSGVISGNGSVTNDGPGKTILVNNNTYSGDTVINAGTLQLGNGGGSGSLNGAANITNNSMLIFNSTANSTYTGGGIHGTGNVEIKAGVVKAVALNDYTGWTLIDSGATFTPTDNNTGNPGILSTSVITNNGTLRLEGYTTRTPMYANIVGTGKVQVGGTGANFDQGDQVLAGTNSYTGGSYIGETHLVLGDGATPGAGAIVGNVYFVNNFEDAGDGGRRLIFNRPDDFTFSGNIVTNFSSPQNNLGIVQQNGMGTVTLTGTNSYGGGTVINAGAVQVGDGGTRGTIGFGQVTDNGILVWNRADNVSFTRQITGTGSLVQFGAGTLTLSSTNLSYTGPTTVSNGTLIVTGEFLPQTVAAGGGDLDLAGGTFIPGGMGAVVTNVVGGNLNINAGTLLVTLNKSVPGANTFFAVTNELMLTAGTINVTGGTLRLINVGPLLTAGDKFTIFSEPSIGGTNLTIVSPGFTVANNLDLDGSVTVTGALPPPVVTPSLSNSVAGPQLVLSWPANWTGGVHLQVQTNAPTQGLGTNWVTVPGTDLSNSYVATIVTTNGSVFYRLIAP